MNDVGEWLSTIGLEEYSRVFSENAIDLSVLKDLTEQDLKDLGVLLGHRRKMLRAIADNAENGQLALATEATRHPAAERRQLTVMFCDLVGSTALSAQLDPEDMRQVIATYNTRMTEIISVFKGVVAGYLGDGVLAYFGYPSAHEDDAEQATHAGLAIIEAISGLQTHVKAKLKVRVGIATGTVVVGDLLIGEAGGEQGIVGDTPNLAARLQTAADPGTLLICANTRRLTGGHFQYRELGGLTLKGWVEPVPAWQVVGTSGLASRFEAQHAMRVMPLLGREEEIELLLRRWRSALDAEGRIVVLTGEPGIGKSHIALTVDERLKSEPHIRLRYFCSPHHTNSVLFPFINQIVRAARIERGDPISEKFDKLASLFSVKKPAKEEDVALLANLLSFPADQRYPLPELTPQVRKEKTLALLLEQLEPLTARQPVLMIFEDAHWADPTSLELLAATVERAAKCRLLLLVTGRPEFSPPWPAYAHSTTVSLTRLGRREGAALIERVTGGKTLPEEVHQQILSRADGVPLFVEELTKTVIESGLLQQRDGRYVLDQPLPSFAIPTTLHASLMARLDRLAPVREVAQIGAVVGREFSFELLSAVAGMPKERLSDALAQLVQSELIFQRGEIPQAVYTFKHALVRDAAYAGLLKTRRAQLHAAIAVAIEERFPEIVDAQPETLAHHLTVAGLNERAAHYWLKAGMSAAHRSANPEAIAHLQRGIEAVRLLPDMPTKLRTELDFQLALGPTVIAAQGPASATAVATFARARELCEALSDVPEYLQVMFWLVTASVIRGELLQAHEAITALLRLAEARGDRPALLNAMRGEAMILLFMGRLVDAREALERAVGAFSASTDAERMAARAAGQDAGVANLALMSWTLWALGQVDEAVTRINAALQRAEAVEHPHSQAYATYYAAVLLALRGEPGLAKQYAERCVALSEEHGFGQWRGLSGAVRGICSALLDDAAATLPAVVSALEDYRRAGYQLGITALYVLLCPVLLNSGQQDSALDLIEQGIAIANQNSERIFEAELYRLKGRALMVRNSPEAAAEAETLLRKARSTAKAQHARTLELRAAMDLASLWINQNRRQEARDLVTPIYLSFTEGYETTDLVAARSLLELDR